MWKQIFVVLISLVITTSALALDPLAPRAQRSEGMIYVFTPQANDTVEISKSDGFHKDIQAGKIYWVPIGHYTVKAKMQEHTYVQHVLVQPTERTDVIVAGFGNLKVNSIHSNDLVEVYHVGKGNLAAKFPSSQTKTLPMGRYDVKVNVDNTSVTKKDVWVITNTTRQVDVTYADAKAPQ